jgi:P27 family predicted phage terminase small subunit
MKGRKPKPTALRVLQGKAGHRPLNDSEPELETRIPACPVDLSDEAKLEWNRLAPYLFNVGVITEADRSAFAAYCQTFGRWIQAERILSTEGEIIMSTKGNRVQNPHLWVANRALGQMHKFCTEFGLTPASRSRLKIDKPSEDEMDAFLARGKKLRQG